MRAVLKCLAPTGQIFQIATTAVAGYAQNSSRIVTATQEPAKDDIEACLRSVGGKLYHMGFRGKVARSTLADV